MYEDSLPSTLTSSHVSGCVSWRRATSQRCEHFGRRSWWGWRQPNQRVNHFPPKTILAAVQEAEVLAVTSWEGPGHALRSVSIVMSYNGSIELGQVSGGQMSEVGVESVPIHRTSFSYFCQRQFKEGRKGLSCWSHRICKQEGWRREGDPPTLTQSRNSLTVMQKSLLPW